MNESFGPGGFDASISAGAANGFGVPGAPKAEGIVPVFIKQIQDSSDDGLKLFGMQFGMLSIMGIVRSVDHSSTKITYKMEDHTGQIDAHYWLEEGDTLNAPQIVVNTYARIYGSLRQQGGVKTIMIFKIESLQTINELTTHLLEVLNARYKAEEYSKKIQTDFNNFSLNLNGNTTTDSHDNSDNNKDELHGLKGNKLLIYKAIKNHISDEGISLKELQSKFSHIPQQEVQKITDFMTQEGHVYTSIDPNHFLCTDTI